MLLHFSTGKYFHQCIHMWLVYCVHINICPFNDMYCGLCNGLWSNSWHIFLCVTGRTSKPDMGVFDRFLHARILSFFFLPAPFLPLPLVLFVLFLCLRTFDCAFSLRACAVPVARSFVLVLQFASSSLRIPKHLSLVPFFCVCAFISFRLFVQFSSIEYTDDNRNVWIVHIIQYNMCTFKLLCGNMCDELCCNYDELCLFAVWSV